jgi:hypothetical protein
MGERRGGVRAVPGVWQRLRYGPAPAGRARRQARPARGQGAGPVVASLSAASVLVAVAARWTGV